MKRGIKSAAKDAKKKVKEVHETLISSRHHDCQQLDKLALAKEIERHFCFVEHRRHGEA